MEVDNLTTQKSDVIHSGVLEPLSADKVDVNREKMPEEEIKKRLSGRALEYLMFIDD